jgi:hypothetical protein
MKMRKFLLAAAITLGCGAAAPAYAETWWVVEYGFFNDSPCVTADMRKPTYAEPPSPAVAFKQTRDWIEELRARLKRGDLPWNSTGAESARSTPMLWDHGDEVDVGFRGAPGDSDEGDNPEYKFFRTKARCEVEAANWRAFSGTFLNERREESRESNPDLKAYR